MISRLIQTCYTRREATIAHIAVGLVLGVSCRLALATATLHEKSFLLSRVRPFLFDKPSTTGAMNSDTVMHYKRGCFHVPKRKAEHFNVTLPSSRDGEISDRDLSQNLTPAEVLQLSEE